jgi:glycosyltransferase involved in cell wall biosynthesis
MLLEDKAQSLDSEVAPPYRVNLFCLPAFDMVARVFMHRGAKAFEGYHNVGWWPWELSVFPSAWRPHAFDLVDEVWASSNFLLEMYRGATNKPVSLMPLAVSVERAKSYPRRHFGLPDGRFLFLFIFDFNSAVTRKNPTAVVSAFIEAFSPSDQSVGLVLKMMNRRDRHPKLQDFIRECQRDPRIQLITQTLDRPEVLGLVDACDAYVSLHRAEGFGRTLAEAMLFGKPVVATHYSGNVDFMDEGLTLRVNHDLVPVSLDDYQWIGPEDGAVWAQANVSHAAEQLVRAKQRALQPDFSNAVKGFAHKTFAPSSLSTLFLERVRDAFAR